MNYLYTTCNVYPTYSVIRPIFEKSKSKSRVRANYNDLEFLIRDKQNANLKNNNPKGIMSIKAQKRIKNAINWLAMSVPKKKIYNKTQKKYFTFQLGLLTLTLPSKQIHTDQEIKKYVLQPFIDYMRKAWLLKNYIWKAETQANGNIHFHIVIDEFIHKKAINAVWNKMLLKLNYVGGNASTRIEAIKKVNDIGAYMAKYLSKNDKERRMVEGKLWACSESLSEKKTKIVFDTNEINENYSKLMNSVTSKKKELIIYNKSDTEKERGYHIGEIFLYKWKNLMYLAKSELLNMVNAIRKNICGIERNLYIEYSG